MICLMISVQEPLYLARSICRDGRACGYEFAEANSFLQRFSEMSDMSGERCG